MHGVCLPRLASSDLHIGVQFSVQKGTYVCCCGQAIRDVLSKEIVRCEVLLESEPDRSKCKWPLLTMARLLELRSLLDKDGGIFPLMSLLFSRALAAHVHNLGARSAFAGWVYLALKTLKDAWLSIDSRVQRYQDALLWSSMTK
jgi:hypothetical protein